MYTMYMKVPHASIYTVAELRQNLREVLNRVKNGDTIMIARHDESYQLTYLGSSSDRDLGEVIIRGDTPAGLNYLEDDGGSHDIRPDLPKYKGQDKLSLNHHDVVPRPASRGNISKELEEMARTPASLNSFCEHGYSYKFCKHDKCRKKAK